MKAKKLRQMSEKELEEQLDETETELRKLESNLKSGMQPENPANIKELKKDIARIKTIQKQRSDKQQ